MKVLEHRLAMLPSIVLEVGIHDKPVDPEQPVGCAVQIAGWLAGEQWSAVPACVLPELRIVVGALNDAMARAERQQLKLLLPRLIQTAGDRVLLARLHVLGAEWIIKVFAPTWRQLADKSSSWDLGASPWVFGARRAACGLPLSTDEARKHWDEALSAASRCHLDVDLTVRQLQQSVFELLVRLLDEVRP